MAWSVAETNGLHKLHFAALLRDLSQVDLSDILSIEDPQTAWDHFYREAFDRFDRGYPMRTVTTTSAEPFFITPECRLLLRRKNRLRRAGRTEEASACARRVGMGIERTTTAHLHRFDSKELWRRVMISQKGRVVKSISVLFSPLSLSTPIRPAHIDG